MIRGSKGHFNINCVNCLKLHNEIQVIPWACGRKVGLCNA